ncbi:MAG: hypothetical protein ACTSYI_14765 [Promethearchaeota archaeon]
MTNFLTSLQQFLVDLGGGEYYHVIIKGKGIYGFNHKMLEAVFQRTLKDIGLLI